MGLKLNAIIASLLIGTSLSKMIKRTYEDGLGDVKHYGLHFEWDYNGLESALKWGSFSSLCDSGLYQTPIDIEPESADALEIGLVYNNPNGTQPNINWVNKQEGKIQNLGDTIKFVPKDATASKFTRPGAKSPLNLLQFHIHTPSEHRVNNFYYPAEIHFVHTDDPQNPKVLAVVGAFIEIAPASDPFLKDFIQFAASWCKSKGDYNTTYTPDYTSIVNVLKGTKTYYRYTGSLTTPPCTEGVKWLVADSASKLKIAPEDFLYLRQLIGYNSRVTMPLRGLYDTNWAEGRQSDFDNGEAVDF